MNKNSYNKNNGYFQKRLQALSRREQSSQEKSFNYLNEYYHNKFNTGMEKLIKLSNRTQIIENNQSINYEKSLRDRTPKDKLKDNNDKNSHLSQLSKKKQLKNKKKNSIEKKKDSSDVDKSLNQFSYLSNNNHFLNLYKVKDVTSQNSTNRRQYKFFTESFLNSTPINHLQNSLLESSNRKTLNFSLYHKTQRQNLLQQMFKEKTPDVSINQSDVKQKTKAVKKVNFKKQFMQKKIQSNKQEQQIKPPLNLQQPNEQIDNSVVRSSLIINENNQNLDTFKQDVQSIDQNSQEQVVYDSDANEVSESEEQNEQFANFISFIEQISIDSHLYYADCLTNLKNLGSQIKDIKRKSISSTKHQIMMIVKQIIKQNQDILQQKQQYCDQLEMMQSSIKQFQQNQQRLYNKQQSQGKEIYENKIAIMQYINKLAALGLQKFRKLNEN